MDLDLGTILIVVLSFTGPALVVFVILTVMRIRRSKFHRQRITKKSSKPSE
jgi:hypothetical protein